MPTFFLDADTIDPSIPTVPILGWSDSFNRADSPNVGVTSREGKVWQHLPIGAGGVAGRIFSNCLTNSDATTNSLMVVEAGSADGVFRSKIAAVGDRWGGLAFRVQDSANYWRVVPRVTSTDFHYVLARVVNGTATTVYTSTINSAASDQLELRVIGTQVTLHVNGVLAIPATTVAEYATATRHGFFLTTVSTGLNWADGSFDV